MDMEPLTLDSTSNTPGVNFDPSNGLLLLTGRSIPEHANNFYRPLIDWLNEYGASKPDKVTLDVKIDYLNSASSKLLMEVFEKLEPLHAFGTHVAINWYYEEDDEEMLEAGEEYDDSIEVPFNFIGVEEFE